MVMLGLNGTSSWRMSSGQYGDNSTHIHSLSWKIKRFKLAIDHCYALTYRSGAKTDCTVYRLVPISVAFTMLFSRITTQRSVSAKANLNKKGHCFTWSLSPGNSGATGITLDTALQKKTPVHSTDNAGVVPKSVTQLICVSPFRHDSGRFKQAFLLDNKMCFLWLFIALWSDFKVKRWIYLFVALDSRQANSSHTANTVFVTAAPTVIRHGNGRMVFPLLNCSTTPIYYTIHFILPLMRLSQIRRLILNVWKM